MAYLYRHIRLDKNVPFYIGVGADNRNFRRAHDKDLRSFHWKCIVKKVGYEVDILMDGLDYPTILEKEKEFISLYGRKDLGLGPLINKTDGGDGVIGFVLSNERRKKMSERVSGDKHPMYNKRHTKESLDKMAKIKIGKKLSKETKEKIGKAHTGLKRSLQACLNIKNSKSNRPVLQYSLDGMFINSYKNISFAAEALNISSSSISKACHGITFSSAGFIWVLKNNKVTHLKINPRGIHINDKKSVLKYDLNGIFILEYSSVLEASKKEGVNISSILTACKSRTKTCKNHLWVYKKFGSVELKIDKYTRGATSKIIVEQYSLSEEYIRQFYSMMDAARSVGMCNTTDISNVCKGKTKTCKGFIWKYKNGNNI